MISACKRCILILAFTSLFECDTNRGAIYPTHLAFIHLQLDVC